VFTSGAPRRKAAAADDRGIARDASGQAGAGYGLALTGLAGSIAAASFDGSGIAGWVFWLAAAGFAGWFAALCTRGAGYGPIGNAAVGATGGFLGALLLPIFGVGLPGLAGWLLEAFVGGLLISWTQSTLFDS
jgi:uncharacterized membrane protein YeaQ/YmgE (transglycosylase-associated protein family)